MILLAQKKYEGEEEKLVAFHLGQNPKIVSSAQEADEINAWCYDNSESDFAKGFAGNVEAQGLITREK